MSVKETGHLRESLAETVPSILVMSSSYIEPNYLGLFVEIRLKRPSRVPEADLREFGVDERAAGNRCAAHPPSPRLATIGPHWTFAADDSSASDMPRQLFKR